MCFEALGLAEFQVRCTEGGGGGQEEQGKKIAFRSILRYSENIRFPVHFSTFPVKGPIPS